jgi:AraC-like DNA-binding protein
MSAEDLPLQEINTAGRGSREFVVRAGSGDRRPWLARAPVCAALAGRHIAHVGWADARHPYRVVRRDLSGTFLMACTAGEGRVWLDGKWQKFCERQACLAPPHVVHAYGSVPGKRWEFAWVRYQEPAGRRPIVAASSPLLAAFDGQALGAAVKGLYHEASGAASVAQMDRWVELIENYVHTFIHPWREDDRLHRLWEAVAADLAADWSVQRLATHVGLSDQQLRRLCVKHLGRKPAEQVAWLRVRHAASMLASGREKVETVARAVGYRSAFTFSTTFRRLTGCLPSDYRGK